MNRFLARQELCDRIEEIEGKTLQPPAENRENPSAETAESRRQRQRDVGLKRQHGRKRNSAESPAGDSCSSFRRASDLPRAASLLPAF